ncbi:transcription initiation factor IIB family protein [Haloarculaceae archaeon H-GB2-1]|nr:transcription initiation factor IIB family protein [Haloarculaceae archaeon H-GB1-1]MEA5409605.1 transcription initiation factor IIB family protein [Haloarculaceae archaeon H-GB2-1]
MSTRERYTDDFDEDSGRTLPTDDCPECSGTLRTDGGEHTCTECGLVTDTYRLAHDAAPRSFDDTENTERTGAPLTVARHDRGLTTAIGTKRDAKGNTLSNRKHRQLARLRREHSRAQFQSKAERNLAHGCSEIARIFAALGLPRDTREQASSLFRSAQSADLLRGRSIESFAAAAVYATSRISGGTLTRDDVAAVAQVARERIANAYDVLNRELALPTPPQRPVTFIPRVASTVGLDAAVERRAREIAELTHEAGLSTGVHPAGFAGACLAVAVAEAGSAVTQRALADAADVSTMTVRTHRRRIQEFLEGDA